MSNNELHDSPIPVLECVCWCCAGKGGEQEEGTGRWRRCDACNGSGYAPTEFGERVLELMRHNFKPMLQDIDR